MTQNDGFPTAIDEGIIANVALSLRDLKNDDLLAFQHLVKACRTPDHVLPEVDEAVYMGLVESIDEETGYAHIHSVTRDIVKWAVQGDEMSFRPGLFA